MEGVLEPEFSRIYGKGESKTELKAGFCPVVESLHVIGNEKKLIIVRYLLDKPMRFNELLRVGLDSKTLSRSLKSLEASGIVRRQVINTQPFSVQYSLTQMGMELKPVIDSLRSWAEKWLDRPGAVSDMGVEL